MQAHIDAVEAELAAARGREAATAEILQIINSLPGDLSPVFDAMLERAIRLCEAKIGTCWAYDGEWLRPVAIRDASAQLTQFLKREGPRRPAKTQQPLFRGARFVQVADLVASDAYRRADPLVRAVVDLGGVRTLLNVPLRKDGALLGLFAIYRQEVRPFTDEQIALLESFAAQAVIAMENARLLTETREALEQQTATAEVLQVINSSPGDLTPVFEAILGKAMSLCGIAFGALQLYEGGKFRAVAVRGVAHTLADVLREPIEPIPGAPPARLLGGEPFVQIADMEEMARQLPDDPRARANVADGLRTVLFVPLRKDADLLGYIAGYRKEVRPFTDKQIALLQNFAAQAVIAMENARLLTETREALEQQTATAEILRVISSSPTDVQPTFDAIAEAATTLLGASSGGVFRYDGLLIHLVADYGWTAEDLAGVRNVFPIPPGRGSITARAILTRDVAYAANMLGDPEFQHPSLTQSGLRSSLSVPMLRDGQPIGAITVTSPEVGAFDDRQIGLLKTFADQAVIAIENVRLFDELNQRTADLQESLEYQTATSDVLKVISRSTFDLQPILDTVCETARRLCSAGVAAISARRGDAYRYVATSSFNPEWTAMLHELDWLPGRDSIAGRVALERRTVHVDDLAADTEYIDRGAVAIGGARTALGVPLLREGEPIGTMFLARQHVEPFTERQIELVRTFADQAVIAIENTRLLTQLRESLEQQEAIAEVLGVINASPGELQLVFESMLDKGIRLCEAQTAHLLRYEGGNFLRVASLGVSEDFDEILPLNTPVPHIITHDSVPYRVLATRAVAHLPDLREDESYRRGAPAEVRAFETGIRTALFVPLLREGEVAGCFVMHRTELRPFTDKQIALLESFAAQAVIAMENARLLGELRERTRDLEESLEYQTATSEVLQLISRSTFDLQPILDALTETGARLCLGEQAYITRREGDVFRFVTAGGSTPEATANAIRFKEEILDKRTFAPGRDTLTGRVLSEGRAVQIIDAAADPEYKVSEIVTIAKARTLLAVPLLREGEAIGTFSLMRQHVQPFTERQIELVRTFADQAVIAIENTRLLTELRESLEQQQAMAEVLGVINASPGELTPVFDAILEKAHNLCATTYGSLQTYDGEQFHAVATRGLAAAFAERLRQGYRALAPHPVHRLLAGERFVQVPDISEIDESTSRAAYELAGIRTVLFVPLRQEDRLLGLISSARREVRTYSDKEIILLESFAAQAVIAMDNARLLDEIRQRQAELRVTFDNMGDGVAMFDADLRLAAWNHNFQQLLDLPDELVEARPSFADYLRYLAERGEYGSADIEAELRRRLGRADQTELRFERTRPDGRVVELRRNAVPGGGFVLIYSDVTERKRAETEIRAARDAAEKALAELRAAQQQLVVQEKMAALGQLTAGIAHEIKNPLNFVNNFAGLSVDLLDELKTAAGPGIATLDESTRAEIDETVDMLTGNLEKIAEHGRRADGIVKSMLLHSRGGSGDWQSVDLNAIVDEALNLAYHGARAQDQSFNITMERDLDRSLAPIEIVPQDVTRVFLNLIGNGFYAAHKRGQMGDGAFRPILKIVTRELGNAVEIRVRDNGTGITPEHRERLFQPFFTTKPTGEGTGLGLSISHDIVTQQHGGTITVDSKVGEFTEFTVRLPRLRHAPAAGRVA